MEQIAALCAAYRDAYIAPRQGDALNEVYTKYEATFGVSRHALKKAIKEDRRHHPAGYTTMNETRRKQVERTLRYRNDTAAGYVRAPQPPPSDRSPLIVDMSTLAEMAERLAPRHATAVEMDKIEESLKAFTESPDDHHGYLAWRFRELSTRPGPFAEHSADEILEKVSLIVDEDKALIAALQKDHGNFLGDRPDVAMQALDAEFGKIPRELSWTSGATALRRSRASLAFLRRAVVLTFASQDYSSHLFPMLARLLPPPTTEYINLRLPAHVIASINILRRVATQVDRFFSGIEAQPGHFYGTGLDQLCALRSGAFDFVLEPDPEKVPQPPTSRLPLVIHPPGERIQPFVTGIRRSGRFRGGEIDERRLDVLTQLWTHLSESGACTMYEGAFPANGKDNGYLILVIWYEGYGEDAVAISPWRGEHATFVVRADAADAGKRRTWKTVLTSTKEEAKELGARRLVFKANPDHGIDEYDAMFQKVIALLVCEPEEFVHGALYFDDDEGRYEVRQA
ncbi:hypothetical protein [Mycolicibacterium arseniciresistens]|uniref:Uncharacterized protein n=1 Tax=Mycolicibacterium arseniciresistens TaxID=3062257 RepID=A0ABT8UKQ4_9MYCO|nr:hypothetical protein [Mycolicibacterium arseniciresistens]MDO3638377.1 hypothetical protein [Mycolicibacterium arseniciresistens]